MRVKVKDIAEIQIGYQSLGRIEADPNGTHRIIQMKDFDECQRLKAKNLSLFRPERDAQRYLVGEGDVLFLSRGHRNFACAVGMGLENTVAASYFFILTPKGSEIHPEYLAWFINQPPAQVFLQRVARRGTHMPVIPKAAFEILEISVPPRKTQETIVRLNDLMERERQLSQKIKDKREEMVRALCLQTVKEQS